MKPAPPRASDRVAQALFLTSLLLLALMATWWFWFLAHSAMREDELWRQNARLAERAGALELAAQDPPGGRPSDARLLVVPAGSGGHPIAGTALETRLAPEVELQHAKAVARRKLMIRGEGAFLLALVLTCLVMLYRLVLAERRLRRDIETFMSRVTHEMKTPLAGLKALLQTMRAGRIPEDRLKELAEMGLRQAEREEHLIENLLTAHRLATRPEPMTLTDVKLAAVLGEFTAHRAQSMGPTEGTIEVRCADALVARVHAGALGTMLENLADNAFKYGARRLVLEARERDGRIVLDARDDGDGFDQAQADALFAPYLRDASASAGRHGTGLGLPIARTLAREMGGDLSARSDGPGKGACFTVELQRGAPLAQARA